MLRMAKAGALVLILAFAAGCPKQTAGPDVSEYQKQRAAIIEKQRQELGQASKPGVQPQAGPEDETQSAFASQGGRYAYDPLGKRDPFRSFVLDRVKERDASAKSPLEQFDLSQLSLTGVVWDTNKRRALILDPSGQNYIVQEGDPIGKNDGRVISISDSSVVVREAYVDFHGERTTKEIEMSVRQSQGG